MRLKSEIWVKAYIRRCATEGVPAVVVNRGDEDAGVIFIKIAHLNGLADLYGPAPAGLVDRLDRAWSPVRKAVAESEVDALIARERMMDRDIWVIEVEDRGGRHFLDDWLSAE
ncbi:MAG: DUF1491 family protein [Hyphomicrobiaceae bacterium]